MKAWVFVAGVAVGLTVSWALGQRYQYQIRRDGPVETMMKLDRWGGHCWETSAMRSGTWRRIVPEWERDPR